MSDNKWMQRVNTKKGALHSQLGVPSSKKIPDALLNKIESAQVGSSITNSSGAGAKRIKVTTLLKRRATLAKTYRSSNNG